MSGISKIAIPFRGKCDCEVSGFLYEADDPRVLGQDMVEVRLPMGIHINAGWYPEGDVDGTYVVAVHGAAAIPSSERATASEAAEVIADLVAFFAKQSDEAIQTPSPLAPG